MKALFIIILSLFFTITAIGQQDYPDSGFTNRTEAKNLMVKGLKEGKWIEYYNVLQHLAFYDDNKAKDSNANSYLLTVYKDGVPYGIVKEFNKYGKLIRVSHYLGGKKNDTEKIYEDGKVHFETPYKNGLKNGAERIHGQSGKLWSETPYINGKKNGIEKDYFVNGKLRSETPYTDDLKNGIQKIYQEDGKTLYVEITFVNDKWSGAKEFDGKGNVINSK